MKPLTAIFVLAITALFVAYAQGVRRGKISGRAIVLAGIGAGAVAMLGMLLLLAPDLKRGLPLPALLVNAVGMALCTAYCIVMAQRQARVEEIGAQGRIALLAAGPFRLPALDALIVPTSTALRSLGGPSGLLVAAGGKGLEKEVALAAPANLDKVIFTGAGNLTAKKLIHAVVHASGERIESARLRRGIQAALLAARKGGAKTVGIAYAPLLGVKESDAAAIYLQAAKKYEDDFEKVVLVLLDGRGEAGFKAAMSPSP